MPGRVRVFIACSLDGFIAGLNDDLSWLPPPEQASPDETGYETFMREVGALLMGRRTFEVVQGFGGEWPYGDCPVRVATHRPLLGAPATVEPVHGSIAELLAAARLVAGERDVYLDGGALIRQALDAGLVDELILTYVPVVLGAGIPLFAGAARRHPLRVESSQLLACGLVQLRLVPAPGPTA